jgi:2-C-methyl-D-erythritol 4-phosphate cytidylyltransferase
VAVILAAGSGVRSGLDYPKQFLRLGGLTVLEHTLLTFESEPLVDQIVVVGAEGWLEMTQEAILASGAKKVAGIVSGGATRNASTLAALDYIFEELNLADCKVLMHDAVRPLLSRSIIRSCVEALDNYDAADVVIETADTIVEVADGLLTSIPQRAALRRGQTPQAFRLAVLRGAYELLPEEQIARFTDDCAVVMAAYPDLPVAVIPGSEENIKITRPIDVYLADRLLQARQMPVPTYQEDQVKLDGTVVVIGGSSGIGEAIVARLQELGVVAVSMSRASGVDVRREQSLEVALAEVRRVDGRICAVVNTSGVLTRGRLTALSSGAIADEIATTLFGAINAARAAHPHLCETEGHLLMFTSSSYTRGRAGYGPYSATKAGVVNITQALAEEWLADRVKVNCINPARTRTPMRLDAFGDEPAGSLLSARDVAETAIAVLSGGMTGHVFDVRLHS